jgi:hypothetical protein
MTRPMIWRSPTAKAASARARRARDAAALARAAEAHDRRVAEAKAQEGRCDD